MKQQSRKLLSVLLALVLLLACAAPAFAEPEAAALEDGTYALPDLAAGPSAMFNHFIAESKQLVVSGDTATVRFITDGSTESIQKYSRIALGKSSELVSEPYQAELAQGVTIIDGVLQPKTADEDPDLYLFEIPLQKAEAAALLANSVDEDIYITVWNNKGAKSNDYVPGWYMASNDIYLSLGAASEKLTEEPAVAVTLEDGAYPLPAFSASLGMFNHFVEGSPRILVDGDGATVRFITDGSTKSIQKYSKIALGKASELLTVSYQTEIAPGVTVIEGVLQPKTADDDPDQYLFEIPFRKSEVEALLSDEAAEDIYIILWNKEGSSTEQIPGWYKPTSGDTYLSLGEPGEKLTEEPEEPTDVPIELTITNNTSMFKAVSASYLDGKLTFALSGTGYRNLFKGTYEEAVANGDNRENWIAAAENAEGKLEFVVPVAEGETVIPLVAISQSYLDKYENGQNPLERAFYPRQAVLDLEAKTLVTGDYEATQELTVTNNVKMFKVSSAALYSVGGPNSNGYGVKLLLTMGSDSFDKAFIGGKDAAAEAEDGVVTVDENRLFTLPVKWIVTPGSPETVVDLTGEPIVISFHSVSKDDWFERQFTLDASQATLVIDEVAEASVPIELTITNNTNMFKAVSASYLDGKLTFALSGTGYRNLFKGTYEEAVANGDNRDNWIAATENAEGKLEFVVPVSEGETVIPLVAISQSYLDKYENGQNPLERAFYPRQAVLDLEAKTLVTGDYEATQELTVTNNVKMFKVSGAALYSVGGPNSNGYGVKLLLTMGSDSFDKAFIGGKDAAAAAEDGVVAVDENRLFTLPVKWIVTPGSPETVVDLTGEPIVISFHSVSKDDWYERQFTLDASQGTLVIDEVADDDPGTDPGTDPGGGDEPTDTAEYADGTYTVPFSMEGLGRHNVAWDTCTVHVVNGKLYIDFTLERVEPRTHAPQFDWAEASAGRVTPVIDNDAFTCTFRRLPVPSLGRVAAKMQTSAMSEVQIIDYVLIIDGSGIPAPGSAPSGGDVGTQSEITITTEKAEDGTILSVDAVISERAVSAAEGEPITLPVTLPAAKNSEDAAELTITVPEASGPVAVEIPVTDVSVSSVVVLVHADGTEEILPAVALTENGLLLEVEGSVTVRIIDNEQSFTDLPETEWQKDAIRFMAARGLMNGVGSGAFAPDGIMSRAMIAAVLYRLARQPDVTEQAVFTDVPTGKWYSRAITWAAGNGIVEGYGKTFGPKDALTCEQLAVMLWRIAGKPEAEQVDCGAHSWGEQAMSWAIGVGLIEAGGSDYSPRSAVTRVEVAAIMMRFINLA